MTEYIIDWGGIGARLVELYEEGVPPFLWTKRLRKERLREKVVRCRDCKHFADGTTANGQWYSEPYCRAIGSLAYGALFEIDDNDYCSWGERRGDAE